MQQGCVLSVPNSCLISRQVLWDVATGTAICGTPTHADFTQALKFFKDDPEALITGGSYNCTVWRYDKVGFLQKRVKRKDSGSPNNVERFLGLMCVFALSTGSTFLCLRSLRCCLVGSCLVHVLSYHQNSSPECYFLSAAIGLGQ